MSIKFASILDLEPTIDFFQEYLKEENKAIYSGEFFCPFGTKGAISRQQIIIVKDNNKIVAALRFYKRKKEDVSSLYQFAIAKTHRKQNLLKQMLKETNSQAIIVQCPKNIPFNNYYKKTGWELEKEDEEFNYWKLNHNQ